MHPNFEKADKLSHAVIGAAIEVHRIKELDCWRVFMKNAYYESWNYNTFEPCVRGRFVSSTKASCLRRN
jgi:hypothetical protein